jgi:hypothetical protein
MPLCWRSPRSNFGGRKESAICHFESVAVLIKAGSIHFGSHMLSHMNSPLLATSILAFRHLAPAMPKPVLTNINSDIKRVGKSLQARFLESVSAARNTAKRSDQAALLQAPRPPSGSVNSTVNKRERRAIRCYVEALQLQRGAVSCLRNGTIA